MALQTADRIVSGVGEQAPARPWEGGLPDPRTQGDIEPGEPFHVPAGAAEGGSATAVRWGWYSIAVNVVLVVLHGFIAAASGSLAVTAELLHNFVDLAAAVAVVAGLKLAMRKSRSFPYGLYKVENIVAAGLAVMIFFTAYEIVSSVFLEAATIPRVGAWMLVSLLVTMVIPLVFSHCEMRVARVTSSPALMADAREYRVHAYTTGLAFAALLSAWLKFPLDRIAALIIVVAVAKTGWDLLTDALRVLLDASLDPKCLAAIENVIAADPAIGEIKWITGHNAGRFRFAEAGVTLRLTGLAQAEAAIARIETAVRTALPQVERVLLHVEPRTSTHDLYAIPAADLAGAMSEHFGEAPYFAFVRVHRATGAIEEQHVRANPHRDEERSKGLRVAEWLVEQKVDRVIVPRSLDGKGPAYVFRDAGIKVEQRIVRTIAELFAGQRTVDAPQRG
jgi:cation diffusion facilitator family transporter